LPVYFFSPAVLLALMPSLPGHSAVLKGSKNEQTGSPSWDSIRLPLCHRFPCLPGQQLNCRCKEEIFIEVIGTEINKTDFQQVFRTQSQQEVCRELKVA
jgi:hypothetical protein